MILIGLCGAAGAGKSTAAAHLRRHGFERIRLAGILKDMLKVLGLSDEQVDGSLKETPCALLGGKTPRWAMQSLGTEWGRQLISESLWIDAWAAKVNACGQNVVVDDVRFPNEVDAIKRRGGYLVKITGRGVALATGGHASETMDLDVDEEIANDGSIEEMNALLDRLVERLKAENACFS